MEKDVKEKGKEVVQDVKDERERVLEEDTKEEMGERGS